MDPLTFGLLFVTICILGVVFVGLVIRKTHLNFEKEYKRIDK